VALQENCTYRYLERRDALDTPASPTAYLEQAAGQPGEWNNKDKQNSNQTHLK
jgi:hypothetical protein